MDHGQVKKNKLDLVCFLVAGFANVISYCLVVIAAEDILSGLAIPTSAVLLGISGPGLLMVLASPIYFDKIGYSVKIYMANAIAVLGNLIIALAVHEWKLAGVGCISISKVLGDMSYFGLTAFYRHSTVGAYTAGTGLALVIANLYYLPTTVLLHVSPRTVVLGMSWVPLLSLASYIVLKRNQASGVGDARTTYGEYKPIPITDQDHQTNTVIRLSAKQKIIAIWNILHHIFALVIGICYALLSLQGIVTTLVNPQSNFAPREVYVIYSCIFLTGSALGRSYGLALSFINPDLNTFTKHTWAIALTITFLMLFLLLDSWYRFSESLVIICLVLSVSGFLFGAVFFNVFAVTGTGEDAAVCAFSRVFAVSGWEAGMLTAGLIAVYTEPILQKHCKFLMTGTAEVCLARSEKTVL